jgi:outer membrane immunogenic protein
MKKLMLTTAALVALTVGSAGAADLPAGPVYKAPPPVPVWTWSGFYIGLQGGGGWGTSDDSLTAVSLTEPGASLTFPVTPAGLATNNLATSGVFGGADAGINWQTGPLVLGVEGDINWSNIDGTGNCSSLFGFLSVPVFQASCNTKMPWFATATGRIGMTVDHALMYVKGGAAWAEFDHNITTGATTLGPGIVGPTYAVSDNRFGFTVGAGVEYALSSNWSAKLEYDYMDFGTKNLALTPTTLGLFAPIAIGLNVDDRERVQLIKAGLNYRFSWGELVVARY